MSAQESSGANWLDAYSVHVERVRSRQCECSKLNFDDLITLESVDRPLWHELSGVSAVQDLQEDRDGGGLK